jgi:hypothetical protein
MTLPVTPPISVRLAAVGMLGAEVAIHAYLAPDHLREIPYVGALFVASCVLLTIAALGILAIPHGASGWALGTALCAGMAIAFVASRTVGLPGFHEAWTSDNALGLIALAPGTAFLGLAAQVTRRAGYERGEPRAHARPIRPQMSEARSLLSSPKRRATAAQVRVPSVPAATTELDRRS